jgi:hypothetical protein
MKNIRTLGIAGGFLALAGLAFAQSAISAKAGMVNYVEGKVLLDGKPVQMKFGVFPQIANDSQLRTEDGRAEVLLSPGAFIRIGEDSGIRMISDRLTDTRLELLDGSAMVECGELGKGEALTVTYKDATVTLLRNGLYRLDSTPAQLKVYDGEANVTRGGETVTVKRGRMLALEGVAVAQKFDEKTGDALTNWARRRSEYVATANISAARQAGRYGMWGTGGWAWSSAFGMYTYVPMYGSFDNYWGYRFWSPYDAYYYVPAPSGWSGGSSSLGTAGLSTAAVQSATSTSVGRALGSGGSLGGASHITGGGPAPRTGTGRKP